jgi:hypothetical protein
MFNKMAVQNALKYSLAFENNFELPPEKIVENQSSVISQLIFDIFGGKILKTHKKKGWHFYNLIDDERIDFAISEMGKSDEYQRFEDLPSTPGETTDYFEQEEYSNFFNRFIWAFEEAVGFDKFQHEVPLNDYSA